MGVKRHTLILISNPWKVVTNFLQKKLLAWKCRNYVLPPPPPSVLCAKILSPITFFVWTSSLLLQRMAQKIEKMSFIKFDFASICGSVLLIFSKKGQNRCSLVCFLWLLCSVSQSIHWAALCTVELRADGVQRVCWRGAVLLLCSLSHCCDCRRKSLSGQWKTNLGQSILEEVPVIDRYRSWIDAVRGHLF